MQKEFAIGKVKPKNRFVLAPMAGISDLPFRLLCRKQGAGLCFTEMINTEAVARNNKYAFRLSSSNSTDKPLGLQLFGAKISSMRLASEKICGKAEFDFLDLNLGCPDQRVLRQGAGAALLLRPKRAAELIKVMKETGRPVSSKIRLSTNILHSIKLCKLLEKAGASCITVHGRTVRQKYSGKSNFVAIKRIAKSLSIPVIANGDINSGASAETTLEKTGAAAVMVGRAAIGNPGIFAELLGKNGISPLNALFKYTELCAELAEGKFGKRKTQVIRFLSKAKQQEAVQRIQKVQDWPALLKVVHSLKGV